MKVAQQFLVVALFVLAIGSVSAYNVVISTDDLPYTGTINLNFTAPMNASVTTVCSSFFSSCSGFTVDSVPETQSFTLSVPAGTSSGVYEHYALGTAPNYSEQQNVSVQIVDSAPQVTASNFSINVTLSTTLTNYYFVQFYGPDGASLDFSIGEVGKAASITGSRQIGENNVEGVYQFFYSPLNNGLFQVDVEFSYGGSTFTKQQQFNVNIYDDLNFDFTFSPSNPLPGDQVNFTLNLISYEEPLVYLWDFNGDGNADATTANATYTYTSGGIKKVNLTVTDKTSLKTLAKNVNVAATEADVTIIVNEGSTRLKDVEVTFGDTTKKTDSVGKVNFSVSTGMYDINVTKEGYVNHSTKLNVTEDITYTITLSQAGPQEPEIVTIIPEQILLESPSRGRTFDAGDTLNFRYTVENAFLDRCQIYLQYEDGDPLLRHTRDDLPTNTQVVAEVSQLREGNYSWFVKCRDIEENEAESEVLDFFVTSERLQQVNEEFDLRERELESFTEGVRDLNTITDSSTKQILSLLDIERKAYEGRDDLKKVLDSYEKIDVTLDEVYFEKEIERLSSSAKRILDETVLRASVLDSAEFVYLPSSSDIEDIAERYATAEAPEKFSLQRYLKEVNEIQKEVTIKTNSYLVELEYGSGRKEFRTFVMREVDVGDLQNVTYLEMFPEEYVGSFSEVEVINGKHEVIEFNEGPLFEVEIRNDPFVTYNIKKQLFSGDIERFQAAVLPPMTEQSFNFVGLITLLIFSLGGLIFMFLGLRLAKKHREYLIRVNRRMYGIAMNSLNTILKRGEKQEGGVGDDGASGGVGGTVISLTVEQMSQIDTIIEEVYTLAYIGQDEKCAKMYTALDTLYQRLANEQREEVNVKLTDLKHRLTVLHIRNSMKLVAQHIQNNVAQEAQTLYKEVIQQFAYLPANHRNNLQAEVLGLKQQIMALYGQGVS